MSSLYLTNSERQRIQDCADTLARESLDQKHQLLASKLVCIAQTTGSSAAGIGDIQGLLNNVRMSLLVEGSLDYWNDQCPDVPVGLAQELVEQRLAIAKDLAAVGDILTKASILPTAISA